MTRLLIDVVWPKATLASQSIPKMNVLRRLLAPRNVEILTARCAGSDEHRVVAFREQVAQRVHILATAEVDTEPENIARLLVDDFFRQAELRDLGAHHAAGAGVAVVDHHFIAERCEVARDGERGGAGADAGDAPAILLLGRLRQQAADVLLVVGGDSLQPADGDRLLAAVAVRRFLLDAAAPARRFAGAVARSPEDAGKDVRHPIDHVGVAVAAGGDQADVLGDGSVGGAGPLAINDFVEVVGRGDVGGLQDERILSWNESGATMSGPTRNELPY
jgi:hypothetical protein